MLQTNSKHTMAETRPSVHVYCSLQVMSNSSVFELCSKVLRSSADLQLYDLGHNLKEHQC